MWYLWHIECLIRSYLSGKTMWELQLWWKKKFQYSDIIQNLKNDYIKFEKCNEYKKLGKLQKGKREEKNILQDNKPIYTWYCASGVVNHLEWKCSQCHLCFDL